MSASRPIPTNLISGFLGAGKTTAILHLLRQKPADERWAVLVNEFGEIGIDGAILAGEGAYVREVTGGCICCVAGLPLRVGLNLLIAQARPDRLLIEPTGLAHPQQIGKMLTDEHYRSQLELRANLCLIDPRKLADARYLDNDTFNAQLRLADLVVGTKSDLCDAQDRQRFEQLLAALPTPRPAQEWVAHGQIDPAWLDLPRLARPSTTAVVLDAHHHHHHGEDDAEPASIESVRLAVGQRFVRRENQGQGHYSCGWLFAPDTRFSLSLLMQLVSQLTVLRCKAVVDTSQGRLVLNMESGALSVSPTRSDEAGRIEIIDSEPLDWDAIEQELLLTLQ